MARHRKELEDFAREMLNSKAYVEARVSVYMDMLGEEDLLAPELLPELPEERLAPELLVDLDEGRLAEPPLDRVEDPRDALPELRVLREEVPLLPRVLVPLLL